MVDGGVGQKMASAILAEQVRFVAFAVRRNHQLSGFLRPAGVSPS